MGSTQKKLPDVCTHLQELIQTRPRCRDSGDYDIDRFETVLPGFPGREATSIQRCPRLEGGGSHLERDPQIKIGVATKRGKVAGQSEVNQARYERAWVNRWTDDDVPQ